MTESSHTDCRGLPITAPSADAVERLDGLIDELYYYKLGFGDRLDELLADFSEFPFARILKIYSLLSEGTSDVYPKIEAQLAAVDALPTNPREQLHLKAQAAALTGNSSARGLAWEQLLCQWPLDLLAYRQFTGALFWTGEKRYQAEVSAGVASHWHSEIPGYGHFLSGHAFAMEEVGQYALAERHARAALEIQPQDLWALHGLSHVFEMQGRNEEGIALLEEAAAFLNDYNLFRGHLWWHLSLFQLGSGKLEASLDLFDREIYPKSSTFYLDLQNGASLLARLEFQGMDVGIERWQRLAEAARINGCINTLWFTSMHHVMAQLRAGEDEAATLTLNYLQDTGSRDPQAALAHELSLAAKAYYRDKPAEALQKFLALRQRQGQLGASHAQQDLYAQLAVMAALQMEDWDRVRQLLKTRLYTRVSDSAAWESYADQSAGFDKDLTESEVRTALRWD